jgi:hypothetical protein
VYPRGAVQCSAVQPINLFNPEALQLRYRQYIINVIIPSCICRNLSCSSSPIRSDIPGSLHKSSGQFYTKCCTNPTRCSAVQCSAVQCSAMQCGAVQYSAAQCRAVQCSAVQCPPPGVRLSEGRLGGLASTARWGDAVIDTRWQGPCAAGQVPW